MSASLLIFAAAFLILAAVVYIVYYKVIKFAKDTGVDMVLKELTSGDFKETAEAISENPKSLSAMTDLELRRIKADFPEFNWDQWKQYCEQAVHDYYAALTNEDTGFLTGESAGLKEQADAVVQDLQLQEIHVRYEELRIHRTEISGYKKTAGTCRILIQSAVQYYYSQTKQGTTSADRKREQHRLQLELVYIQDPGKSEYQTAVGPVCPGCGAPITALGNKSCPYCGRAVETINSKVWTLMSLSDIS